AVVVGTEENAERCRRLAELLDLFGQGLDLVALVTERVGELLILAHRLCELLARLDELLLEDRDLSRCVGQAAAEEPDLFFQELDLGSQLVDLLTLSGHLRLLRASRIYTCGPTRSGTPRSGSSCSVSTARTVERLRTRNGNGPCGSGHPARDREESGVADHPVFRPDAALGHVPS